MIVKKAIGNIVNTDIEGVETDTVEIEWYEADKRVLHKTTRRGVEVGIHNHEGARLGDGDILWQEGNRALLVEIRECRCIALKPTTMEEMGRVCYEIGNRHAPLFTSGDELLTPFDEPLLAALAKCGFSAEVRNAKLIKPLGGHGHGYSHSHKHAN